MVFKFTLIAVSLLSVTGLTRASPIVEPVPQLDSEDWPDIIRVVGPIVPVEPDAIIKHLESLIDKVFLTAP